ncbi:hypothetical protein Tco_0691426 [Tanacetum coccineum]
MNNTGSLNINTGSPIVTTAPTETTHADYFEDETEVDMSNISTTYPVPSTPNTRIHKDHSLDNVIGDVQSSVQTRRMTKTTNDQGFISAVYEGKTHEDLHTCLFACFLSQEEPKRIAKALSDLAWVEAMQEELLQFKLQKGYSQEEGIYYDEVFAPVARIEAIRMFLAYASFMIKRCQAQLSTPMNTEKPLLKDSNGDDVDVNIYRYLKGQPKLGLWYPRDSPFDLVAYSDSDYAGASLDRKSTTGGCQFLGCRLISWQCKKQTVVATSSTEAEYVAAASCYGQIVDFLTASHIRYALTESPTIHVSLIEQFWQIATASTLENGDMKITATIDEKVKVVSEASIRRHLKLEDSDGISNLPTTEIFEQLALMSSKKTAWEQFSSNIATAIICLATNRTFNFLKLIFDGMVKNLDSKTKFLMYPRFIQIFLNKHKRLLLPHKRLYIAPTLTQKLFSNMKRASKGYTGVDTPLFQTMLVQGQIL